MVKKQPKSSNIFTPEQEKYTFSSSRDWFKTYGKQILRITNSH